MNRGGEPGAFATHADVVRIRAHRSRRVTLRRLRLFYRLFQSFIHRSIPVFSREAKILGKVRPIEGQIRGAIVADSVVYARFCRLLFYPRPNLHLLDAQLSLFTWQRDLDTRDSALFL